MDIALIDSGIDTVQYPDLVIKYDLIVEENGIIRNRKPTEAIHNNHGTTCARIIQKYAPHATFCSLDIFRDTEMCGSIVQLIAALEWCYENCVQLIHLSVGSIRFSDYSLLTKIVARLLVRDQIIVAAQSNREKQYTMPACFLGVFGVEKDSLLSESEYRVEALPEPDEVCLKASSLHKLPSCTEFVRETALVNSYAAPTITAQIYNLLSSEPHCSDFQFLNLFHKLTQNFCPSFVPIGMRPDFASDVIVFDPNNELEDYNLLSINIKGLFTSKEDFINSIRTNKKLPILIIPQSAMYKDTSFWQEICDHSKSRTGIVVAGKAPRWVKRNSPCLLWDEQNRIDLMSRASKRFIEVTIPIIYVEPWGQPAFRTLCRLKNTLRQNGFECIALSDQSRSYLYGVEYIHKCELIDVFLAHFSQCFKPDVFLCMIKKKESAQQRETLTISLDTDTSGVYYKAENQIVVPSNPTNEDLLTLLFLIS